MQIATYISAVLSVLVFPIAAAENAGAINAPAAGYARNSGTIRPVYGIPGAALFGSAIDLHGVEPLAISFTRGYAIGLDAEAHIRIVQLSTGAVADVQDVYGPVNQIVLSSAGTTAA